MATLAAWYDQPPDSEPDGRGEQSDNLHRVRPLPNEDICLWENPVDNSKVTRPASPEVLEACWRFITVASLVVILTVGLLLPGGYGLIAGYDLHRLESERAQLLAERQALELEESRLLTPERLEELARQQEFEDPPPDRVVYLTPPDGSAVAYLKDQPR